MKQYEVHTRNIGACCLPHLLTAMAAAMCREMWFIRLLFINEPNFMLHQLVHHQCLHTVMYWGCWCVYQCEMSLTAVAVCVQAQSDKWEAQFTLYTAVSGTHNHTMALNDAPCPPPCPQDCKTKLYHVLQFEGGWMVDHPEVRGTQTGAR